MSHSGKPNNWVCIVAYSTILAIVVGGVTTTLRLNGLARADHVAMWRGYGERLQIERCKASVAEARYLESVWSGKGDQNRPDDVYGPIADLGADLHDLAKAVKGRPISEAAANGISAAFESLRGNPEGMDADLVAIGAMLNHMSGDAAARQTVLDREWRRHQTLSDAATKILGAALVLAIFGLGYISRKQKVEQQRNYEAANELQLRMKWLALHFPVPAVYVEDELVILNRCAQDLTGYSRREVTTLDEWFALLHRENAAEARKGYETGKRGGFKYIPNFTIIRKDGTPMQIELAGHRGRGGEVWVLRDVTELFASRERLQEANSRLHELAAIDGLTGVMNRRVFFVRLREECYLAIRLERQLSVLVFDVDQFKAYNDAFGHPEGDAVLRSIGEIITNVARKYDSVARYGGEEFALILPGAGREEAMELAEVLRHRIEQNYWRFRRVTISVGVATTDAGPIDADQLVFDADRALYAAKHAGRNTVVHAADIDPGDETLRAA